MKKYSGIIWSLVIIVLIVGSLILISRSKIDSSSPVVQFSNGVISAEETAFDFGTISMAKGKVSHSFKIKNTGSEPLTISKIYTSCMCTEATFIKGDVRKGPVGMAGHGYVPKINEALNVGEEAEILVFTTRRLMVRPAWVKQKEQFFWKITVKIQNWRF